jgi:hypothetical protein
MRHDADDNVHVTRPISAYAKDILIFISEFLFICLSVPQFLRQCNPFSVQLGLQTDRSPYTTAPPRTTAYVLVQLLRCQRKSSALLPDIYEAHTLSPDEARHNYFIKDRICTNLVIPFLHTYMKQKRIVTRESMAAETPPAVAVDVPRTMTAGPDTYHRRGVDNVIT